MTKRLIAMACLGLVLATGCKKDSEETKPPEGENTPPPAGPTERASLTDAECQAQGGTIVGDIGDGAIHKPDYVCESGKPPIGNVTAPEGGPTPIEGSVCCPAP
jgi:hypothetical protein